MNKCKDCYYGKDFGHCKERRGSHQYCFTPKKQTNYDRIRNMSVEELAKFIPDWSYTKACKCDEEIYADCDNKCWKCVKEWLESEVEGK